MTDARAPEMWSRVFLIAGDTLQQTMLAQTLERNGCNVIILSSATAVPSEALSDGTITPFAILTPAIEISSLKKSPAVEALLLGGTPLIALKQSLHADRAIDSMPLSDGSNVEHYLVKQMAAPEILKILCETYGRDFGELPINHRTRQ